MTRANHQPTGPSAAPPSPATDETPTAILARAAERGRTKGLPYLGEVTPREAYRLVQAGAARLVDVRTIAEREYVGHVPDTPVVEWRAFHAPERNHAFVDQLARHAARDDVVLLLCRSGGRSHAAASVAAAAGFTRAINVLEGFEGDLDAEGHRNRVNGWRFAGLPWIQT